jgi:thiol-disulfide isomerase/thioredoxin
MKKIAFSLILFSLTAVSLYSQEGEPREYTQTGKKMPVFKVRDVNGVEFDVEAKKGKVIVVYFWATWCPYCREELPYLESELWEKYKSKDFAMIGIARRQTDAEVKKYLKINSSLTFPMAADPTGAIFWLFANAALPRIYLVGRDGKILSQEVGFNPDRFEEWSGLIDEELKKTAIDTKAAKTL